ncbi:MAG: hypothetical protein K0R99_3911 [Microbacterium sp.]|nr:hypothetical protein [Microbacterium sp.]
MGDLRAEAVAWIHTHRAQVSVFGVSPSEQWSAEASTPRVLASAQKVLVFAAVVEAQRQWPEVLSSDVPYEQVQQHYFPRTDGGAHEKALLTDGVPLTGPASGTVSVSRLLAYALHHSSNAASDALADLVAGGTGAARTSSLPPRLSEQFRSAYQDEGGDWLHMNQAPSPAAAASGWRTYSAPLPVLVEAMSYVVEQGAQALRYLPRISVYGASSARGKVGMLPGHRAGVLVRTDEGGQPVIGAYAFSNLPTSADDQALADAVEFVLRAAAARTVTAPFVNYEPKKGTTRATATF